ncbi:MAG TPA: helix-turn-helix domain-containing protein [Elusimicrobiales bacterium]|nr:helix-turn-helix domain-containing protein [Elusimicrobiales bacterium]
MEKEYLSIPEAAVLLGLSRIAVFKQVKRGKLAAIRIGRNWAVPAAALAARGPSRPGGAAVPPAAAPPAPQSSVGERGFVDTGWD